MGDRAAFLQTWFSALEDAGVSWACLRNAGEVLRVGPSDVDLLVAPRHQKQLLAILDEVAQRQGARLLQNTRFASASRVYLPTDGPPFRIDFETQLGWRGFPVLPAEPLLARRRRAEFWVLDPLDELGLLILAAVWRGGLSDRYRERILAILRQVQDSAEISGRFQEAFGYAGRNTQLALDRGMRGEVVQIPIGRIRTSLMLRSLFNPRQTARWAHHLGEDFVRFGERLRRPPGLILQLPDKDAGLSRAFLENGMEKMVALFPRNKWRWRTLHESGGGLVSRLENFWTLFRGGLLIQDSNAAHEKKPPGERCAEIRLARSPGDTFILGYSPAGTMTQTKSGPEAQNHLADGVFHLLAGAPLGRRSCSRRPSKWLVLVGLDGSGKTTLARNLLCRGSAFGWNRLRYAHFLPAWRLPAEFPWPKDERVPRKKAPQDGWARRLLSSLRLLRNVLRAQRLRVLPLQASRPDLLILDRYLYNYWLDPGSVRFVGSRAWIRHALQWAPLPDLVVILRAPAEVLLARKGELSWTETAEQERSLTSLSLQNVPVLELDATRPPAELAELVYQKLAEAR